MATPRPEPLIHNQAPEPFTHVRALTNEERIERWNERRELNRLIKEVNDSLDEVLKIWEKRK